MAPARERGRANLAALDQELKQPAQIRPPVIEALAGGIGYQCLFADAMTRITVDGLRHGRDGLRGELTIEIGPFGEEWQTITGGRLELGSMSQRETWQRRLEKRRPGCDWGGVLDRLCAAILTAEKRLDRPAILLRDARRPPTEESLMPPILHGRLPTLWYGGDGSLKSYVALAAGLSLHGGDAWVGGIRPTRTLKLLYADFEFEDWDHRERMRRLLGLEADERSDIMPDVAYLDCKGSTLVSQVERIQRAARQLESEFLIVDSISYAAEGPLNEDETARLYYRALGQIGLPSLSTAHVPKNGDIMRPFGSAHWRNLCRLAWHFQRVDVSEPGCVGLKLTNTKFSTDAIHPPIGLRVCFSGDRVRIERANPQQMPSGVEPIWRQIQAWLRQQGGVARTYEEIALAIGLQATAKTTAAELAKTHVAQHRDHFVQLPPLPGGQRVRIGLAAEGYGGEG